MKIFGQASARGVVALVVLLLVGCAPGRPAVDPDELEPYARRYVELLRSGDGAALAAHLNNPWQPQDARQRLAIYGPGRWQLQRARWETGPTPEVFFLYLTVRSAYGAVVTWKEILEWDEDGLTMGPLAARPEGASMLTPPP